MQPCTDYVLSLWPNARRVATFEELLVTSILGNDHGGNAGVHPSIEGSSVAFEFCVTALWAALDRRLVPPRPVIDSTGRYEWGATFLTVPGRYLCGVDSAPGDWPVDCYRVQPVEQNLPVSVGMEDDLLRELFQFGKKGQLLKVVFLHRYDFDGGMAS